MIGLKHNIGSVNQYGFGLTVFWLHEPMNGLFSATQLKEKIAYLLVINLFAPTQ